MIDYICNMIEVARYIEKLLLNHDCVILPGFGGFVVYREKAYIEEESGRFYPPYRSIGFNSQLTVNDGLLAQSLMQSYDTDYPNAVRMLEEEINQIKEKLHLEKHWEVGNLGMLELSLSSGLQFFPVGEGGIASPNFYGLDSFLMEPFVKKVTAKIQEKFLLKPDVTEVAVDEDSIVVNQRHSFTKRILRYAAIFIGSLFVFFATSIPVSNVSLKNTRHFSQADGTLYGIPLSSLLFKNAYNSFHKKSLKIANSHIPQKIKPHIVQPTIKKSSPTLLVKQKISEDYYTIVLASSVKKKNAHILVNELSKKGFEKSEVYCKKKMIRVVYSSYSSEKGAHEALHKLRKKSKEFEDGWILHIY